VDAVFQAHRQEMKWGVFCKKKVENGGVFVKKWKMGVFFCLKKVENEGCFFVKKVDLSSTQGALCTVSVLFILHFTYLGVHMHPTHPPCLRACFHCLKVKNCRHNTW